MKREGQAMTVRTNASDDRLALDPGVPVPRLGHLPIRQVGFVMAAVALVVSGAFIATTQSAATAATTSPRDSAAIATAVTSPVSVSVVGNQLVNGEGQTIRLLGADRSGTEYACAQGWGIFDGPNSAASVATMETWDINAVRVPLNEDCWLGINGVNPLYSGTNYRTAIMAYVSTLQAAGLVAILDLHWNALGTTLATGQQVMADRSHAPAFWSSVATTFLGNPGVIFDLYNEPHDISWSCWLHGCTTSAGWATAGMQQMVNAVRATGATQPIMVGGLNWAGDLSGWLAHEPVDPLHQLIASVHIYNFSEDNTVASWNSTIARVAAKVPVVTGELGENDCADGFIDQYMAWADSHGVSYLGWTWDATDTGWSCSGGPALITDYDGTPTAFGIGLETHLLALGGGGSATSGGGTTTTTVPSTTTTTTTPPTTTVPTTTTTTTVDPGTGTGSTVTVGYQIVNQWPGGVQANLVLTNTGTTSVGSAARPWEVGFDLPAYEQITSLWNATDTTTVSGTTLTVTATGPSWQPTLAPGQSWSVGYVTNLGSAAPTMCSVDGVSCSFTPVS
jgi:hypothetical protein